MKPDRMTVLPGPLEHNEIKDLECQPGVTAHTDSKVQSGEVSTPRWVEWRGGECPVPPNTKIELVMRIDDETGVVDHASKPERMRWTHIDSPGDILRYRVIA